jgi:adenine-specific DNA-methyltransferase
MATRKTAPKAPLQVETLKHPDETRKNIPTAEFQSVIQREHQRQVHVTYDRGAPAGPLQSERNSRNRDLDPQLVWRGKDQQDWSDLVVNAPPLYIQEKVHPKVLIDDLKRQSERSNKNEAETQSGFTADLFADMAMDFNGLADDEAKTEFYAHDQHWSNRMILGDSLQVMASLAEREGLRGKVQCIYFDPPYGIKFNSNFQWSTTSRDVKDGNAEHITREPEMVKAFRDTWKDGIHSYLSYIRDRLTVARDLLTDSGSIFVQIGDENVHRVRMVMDEVFGDENFLSEIIVRKTTSSTSNHLANVHDVVIWYKKASNAKFRRLFRQKAEGAGRSAYKETDEGIFTTSGLTSQNPGSRYPIQFLGRVFNAEPGWWKTSQENMQRVQKANRLVATSGSVRYKRFLEDFEVFSIDNLWEDTAGDTGKVYVVQTAAEVVKRCILMASDPGDLVLDPTCGSGTTAYVAEQWGRRWITIDTSRVALALARARIMGARYPFYLLADSKEGQAKEGEVTRTLPKNHSTFGNIRQGFVYERVPHITLKSIANNAEIDVIYDQHQILLEPLREQLNTALKMQWEEWEIPRESDKKWSDATKKLHIDWWKHRIARQQEIDASIAAKADFEYLYDRPYEDKRKVRVAGPFTVESLLPHRVLGLDEDDNLIDPAAKEQGGSYERNFAQIILDNLRTAGVQQAHKTDKINFTSLTPWPGEYVCAEGLYMEGSDAHGNGGEEKRAGIFIGPEFGTVSRPDLVSAAREAGDGGFDVLICCAFNYDAHSSDFLKLGRIPVLKARMNADLHMADDLKNTGKGNLFVVFGEPDIDINEIGDRMQVKVNGVDVFHPNTGEVRSDGADGIACWFIDTDYNEESFFVRHAYFLGANDPYKSLKTTLKAEINREAWESLNSDTSRSFEKPKSGRIAVKVINHLGDEVMKVFKV